VSAGHECIADPTSISVTQRPHVLFVAPSAYTLGGLATWLDYLLPGLEDRGWRATLGLVAGPRHHRPAAYLAKHPWHDSIEIECRSGTETGRRAAMRRIICSLKPDLVCSVNIPDACAAIAELRRSSATNARSVMTCHGIQSDLFRDMRLLASSLDGLICTNRLACAMAERQCPDGLVRMHYVPYGTAMPDVAATHTTGPLRVAYVGRFEEDQKRISDVVGIVRGLAALGTEFQLLVAGGGPEAASFRTALEATLSSHQLVWLGQVPAAELPDRVYRQADVLLLTSRWETGPIVVWEAMAHGVAVVSSRYVGSGLERALVDRENALLFDIGDVDAAAEALVELAGNPAQRQQLARSGRELVESRYSTAKSVGHWDTAFRSLLEVPMRALTPPAMRPEGGRLTSLLGPRWAERLRSMAGRQALDTGPGGEWPHTLTGGEEPGFWEEAQQLDFVMQTHPHYLRCS
jgi:glycosyltransferase involved in cell wall biosynthesis